MTTDNNSIYNLLRSLSPMSPSSSSPSSSSGSSPTPISFSEPPSTPFSFPPAAQLSVEEVWMDLNVSGNSCGHNNNGTRNNSTNADGRNFALNGATQTFNPLPNQNSVLLDFLGRTFVNDPPRRPRSPVFTLFGSPLQAHTPVLTLNSGFAHAESNQNRLVPVSAPSLSPTPTAFVHNSNHHNRCVPNLTSYQDLSSSPGPIRGRNRRREGNPSELRFQRMIKNRESAARSRARRMAYTNELKVEIANLLEENHMLKEQEKKLRKAAEDQLHLTSGRFKRCTSAPP